MAMMCTVNTAAVGGRGSAAPTRAMAALLVMAALAGCASRQDSAPVVFRGTQPGAAPQAPAPAPAPLAPPSAAAATPDANGIVDFGGYQAIIARQGDTVNSMAARAGLTGQALAAYNGLPVGHTPRAGDELILPPRGETRVAAAEPTVAAAPLAPPPGAEPSGFDLDSIGESLETPETGPATGATVAPSTAAAPTGAPATTPPATTEAAPEPAPAAAPERVAAAPAPAATPAPTPAAPAPASGGGRFARPVDGTIARPFSQAAGAGRSDGVSFAAAAGSPVVAADDGQVALVSEALGGDLGTVVLIRHGGQILTVYGRVDPSVSQGDRVRRGQPIGTVASTGDGQPTMHFEVRRGTEPVDPAPFFGS
jgi:murein DD-endopeptidase MepM/ murein hydrolase activator NlpD